VNLHEKFDDAFESLTPPPAPVQDIMKAGTWMRWRRRTTAVVCAAAVVAAAVVLPLTVHWQASPQPAAARYTATVQPPGPHSPANEIAQGTVNGKSWQVLMTKTTGNTSAGYTDCTEGLGPALGYVPVDGACEPPRGATPADPVVFGLGMGESFKAIARAWSAAVASDVSYVTVTLTNGTLLTLHPATVYGRRYIAFAAPENVGAVVRLTAYSRQGEIASAVAFTESGIDTFESSPWLRPGQRGLPRITGTIGSATAYEGPWGICLVTGGLTQCLTATAPLGLNALDLGVTNTAKYTGTAFWTVPFSTARVVVTEHGEKAFQVPPVTLGAQKFVTFQVPGGRWPPSVIAYDSAGHIVGSSLQPAAGAG
jgi:hypothetical protein